MAKNRIKYKLLELYYANREADRIQAVTTKREYERERMAADIVRLTHSLEKGLSIEKIRPLFGKKKIQTVVDLVSAYASKYNVSDTCVSMACDALLSWINWHNDNGHTSEEFDGMAALIRGMIERAGYKVADQCKGGVQTVRLSDMQFDREEICRFFRTRHSIRQFTGEPVDEEVIRAAVNLAQTAPSACNRQGVRVYSIDSRKYVEDMQTDLAGIGGFTDDTDRFLLITGKLSAYDEYEHDQYIVSAGIFAGYLSLALHAYHVGACIIQRSVRRTEEWENFARKNSIPKDEQIVCMIGIGCMKQETVVPISQRYETDAIYKNLSANESVGGTPPEA